MEARPGYESNSSRQMEIQLQRGLQAWIVAGLAFMLLPGMYLGVWNLISIAANRSPGGGDPAWIQAHGHAQIYGWIGSFILGIGFYSLTKMAHIPFFAVRRMWLSWTLWTLGVALRWSVNLWHWRWRWMLPISAAAEITAFLLFYVTVSHHRPAHESSASRAQGTRAWMLLVIAGSLGFLASLLANLAATVQAAIQGAGPAIPRDVNQRLLSLATWFFPVVTIWGFSARWLPVFLGLPEPVGRLLWVPVALMLAAVTVAWTGRWTLAAALFLAACLAAAGCIRIFQRSVRPPKTTGVHAHFPLFVRTAYVWLLLSAFLGLGAAFWDKAGGLWGASRHALTVGFISTMVFAIGQRVLPAFCGMRILYSPALMGWSLWTLTAGCCLRVAAEVGAYESYVPQLWPLLPVSAVIEMAAVTLFAANLLLTLARPPAHLATLHQAGRGIETT